MWFDLYFLELVDLCFSGNEQRNTKPLIFFIVVLANLRRMRWGFERTQQTHNYFICPAVGV